MGSVRSFVGSSQARFHSAFRVTLSEIFSCLSAVCLLQNKQPLLSACIDDYDNLYNIRSFISLLLLFIILSILPSRVKGSIIFARPAISAKNSSWSSNLSEALHRRETSPGVGRRHSPTYVYDIDRDYLVVANDHEHHIFMHDALSNPAAYFSNLNHR